MMNLIKTDAYVCPNGMLETSRERAVAHHVEILMAKSGRAIDFATALWMVAAREQIIETLTMMDRASQTPEGEPIDDLPEENDDLPEENDDELT